MLLAVIVTAVFHEHVKLCKIYMMSYIILRETHVKKLLSYFRLRNIIRHVMKKKNKLIVPVDSYKEWVGNDSNNHELFCNYEQILHDKPVTVLNGTAKMAYYIHATLENILLY